MLKVLQKLKSSPAQKVRELLGAGYELPSFPAAAMNILGLLRDAESSIKEITAQLQIDPGIHVRVLSTVNSAAFGLSTKVSNVQHAATLLGRSRLEALVLSVAVKESLPAPDRKEFDSQQFWKSAARRASLARVLAKHLHPATQTEAFTAGLLQDMAVPILATRKNKLHFPIYDRWKSDPCVKLHELEARQLGFDHAMLGGVMAKEWHLPEYLITAIAGHHDRNSDNQPEPAIILVSYLRDSSVDDGTDAIVKACHDSYGIGNDAALDLIKHALDDAEEYCQSMK